MWNLLTGLAYLSKQWGYKGTDNTGTIPFNITFKEFCVLALTTQSSYGSGVAQAWTCYDDLTLNEFTVNPYNATYNKAKCWIAIGK